MLDRLVEAGVIETVDETLSLSDAFVEAVAANHRRLTDDDREADPFSTLGLDSDGPLDALNLTDELFLAEYAALADRVSDADPPELVQWTILLDQFGQESVPTGGSPEAFLPVSGEKLLSCLKLFDPAVVYAWREECDPCDIVREDFDELFPEPPGDVALFSIYGPDNADLLSEIYRVEGAPTVLFLRNGKVDSRLVGAYTKTVLEKEVDIIRGRA